MVNVFNTPLVVRMEITSICNHRCPYCYNEDFLNKENLARASKQEKIFKIIDLLNEWDVFDITFTGGEPFTEKQLLKDTILYLKKHTDIDYGINSNLSLLDSDTAHFLKETDITGMFFSFMTFKEDEFNIIAGKNKFKQVVKGLKNANYAGIKTTANMVVVKNPINNVADVYNTAKFLYENYQIHKFAVAPISPNKGAHNQFIISNEDAIAILDQMIEIEKDFGIEVALTRPIPICFTSNINSKYQRYDFFRGCTIGMGNSLTLTADGSIKPCPVWDLHMGNIFADSLDTIKYNLSFYDGTSVEKLKCIIPKECVGCEIMTSCKGGCKTEAISLDNDIKAKSRYMKPFKDNMLEDLFVQYDLTNIDLHMRKDIKIRKDKNSYVIRGEKFAILNEAEFELLQYLYDIENFNISKLFDKKNHSFTHLNLFLNKLATAKLFDNVNLFNLKNQSK